MRRHKVIICAPGSRARRNSFKKNSDLRSNSLSRTLAFIVQWIGHLPPKEKIQVRLLVRAQTKTNRASDYFCLCSRGCLGDIRAGIEYLASIFSELPKKPRTPRVILLNEVYSSCKGTFQKLRSDEMKTAFSFRSSLVSVRRDSW